MKIQRAEILLSSQHQAVQKHTRTESLRTWVGDRRPDFEGRGRDAVRDRVALSPQADAAMQAQTGATHQTANTEAIDPDEALRNDPRSLLIRLMVEAFTGVKIDLTAVESVKASVESPPVVDPNSAQAAEPSSSDAQPPPIAGFGVEYDFHESYYEAERTDFSAQGVIRTADGKEISFDLKLSMERVYSREENVSVRIGDAARQRKDPLVINFGGTAAQLTDTKFRFDIDSDGSTENVSFVGQNSGFLALDINGDGKINNGTELFGAKSGDGLKELAAYDQDGNGWIDESDAIFDKLKVWSKDAQGYDQLASLGQKGVGALYLGQAATAFEIRDTQNTSLGAVKSSGLYVNENGTVGTLQQIDLTV